MFLKTKQTRNIHAVKFHLGCKLKWLDQCVSVSALLIDMNIICVHVKVMQLHTGFSTAAYVKRYLVFILKGDQRNDLLTFFHK